jgi:hypothetical protein
VLEISLRAEDRTPSGHVGHDLVDLDQSRLHNNVAPGTILSTVKQR